MSATQKLPPSERDFEIYEAAHLAQRSTRFLAGQYQISQTRVRQIVGRVVEWLAEVLPPKADLDKEKELNLARQIAADRFQHQLEEAAELWRTTHDTRYAGLRIRLTMAQVRLGCVGGLLGCLAADAIDGPEPQVGQTFLSANDSEPGGDEYRQKAEPPAPNPKSAIQNPKSVSSPPTPPPPRDCSPSQPPLVQPARSVTAEPATNRDTPTPSVLAAMLNTLHSARESRPGQPLLSLSDLATKVGRQGPSPACTAGG